MNKTVLIVSIILVISVIINVVIGVLYIQQPTQEEPTFSTSDFEAIKNERDSLKEQVSDLISERDAAIAESTNLNAEVLQLRSSRLLTNLGAFDNRDNSLQPFMHVYGVVWNVGTISAFNSKIHVVGKQGDVVAVDTYIDLTTIPGYEPNEFASFKEIDEAVYYTGPALTEKSITIEYD